MAVGVGSGVTTGGGTAVGGVRVGVGVGLGGAGVGVRVGGGVGVGDGVGSDPNAKTSVRGICWKQATDSSNPPASRTLAIGLKRFPAGV